MDCKITSLLAPPPPSFIYATLSIFINNLTKWGFYHLKSPPSQAQASLTVIPTIVLSNTWAKCKLNKNKNKPAIHSLCRATPGVSHFNRQKGCFQHFVHDFSSQRVIQIFSLLDRHDTKRHSGWKEVERPKSSITGWLTDPLQTLSLCC